jgi:hypothetical protein
MTSVQSSTGGYTVSPGADVNSAGGLVPVKLSAPPDLDWGQAFTLTGTVRNDGSVPTATPAQIDVFASPDVKTGPNSVPIGTVTVPAGIAPNALYDFSAPLHTPGNPPTTLVTGPSYYITTTVGTPSATNTGLGFQGVDAAMVTITPRQPSKLEAAGISVAPGSSDWGQSINVTATITNKGPGNAPPTNARIILVPYGQDPMGPTGYTIGSVPIPQISAYQTASATQSIRLPYSPPSALANVGKFTLVMVSDADGLANPVVMPTTYQGFGIDWTTLNLTARPAAVPAAKLPNVSATSLTTPTVMGWGQTIQVTAHVQNTGAGDAGTFDVRFTLVQSDTTGAPSLILGDAVVQGLKAGQAQDVVQSFTLPSQAPAGLIANAPTGRIIATVDPDHVIDEVRTTGNSTIESPPITLKLVAQDGATTPVVTTTSSPATPKPAGSSTSTSSPASNSPATIPITSNTPPVKVTPSVPKRKVHPPVHKAAPHLKIYPRKRHAIPVTTHKRQIRTLPSRLVQPAAHGPKRPA